MKRNLFVFLCPLVTCKYSFLARPVAVVVANRASSLLAVVYLAQEAILLEVCEFRHCVVDVLRSNQAQVYCTH